MSKFLSLSWGCDKSLRCSHVVLVLESLKCIPQNLLNNKETIALSSRLLYIVGSSNISYNFKTSRSLAVEVATEIEPKR